MSLTPADVFLQELTLRRASIAKMLPPHVDFDRFSQAAWNAVIRSPDLLDTNKVPRESLFIACCEAAEDGLMPDGREGAFVPRKRVVKWQPMAAGLTKLAVQSGAARAVYVDVVYKGEHFEFHGGTDPHIVHLHDLDAMDIGWPGVVAAYAVITWSSGEKIPEVIGGKELERFKSMGAERGPWASWPVEMAKVRPLRRALKRLPLSSDRAPEAALLRTMQRLDAEDSADMPALSSGVNAASLEAPDKLSALESALPPISTSEPERAPVEMERPTPQTQAESPRPEIVKWVEAIATEMAKAKTHADLTVVSAYARHNVDWLREHHPALADKVIAAESAATQLLGPLKNDTGDDFPGAPTTDEIERGAA
jgi:recombination protein RecT